MLGLIGEGLDQKIRPACRRDPVAIGRLMPDEGRGIVLAVNSHGGGHDHAGQGGVIGQPRHRHRIGGKALHPGVQGRIIVRPGIDSVDIGEGIQPVQPTLHQVLEQEGGPGQMADQLVLLDADDVEDIGQPLFLFRRALGLRQADAGAGLHPLRQLGAGHAGAVGQPLPERILDLVGFRMVLAIVLIDSAQVGPEPVGLGPTRQNPAGQDDAVPDHLPLRVTRI
ncbi:hypothetical protein D3C85_1282880 [compost metagenome]